MLGIDPKTARATWTVLLILLLVAVLYEVRHTLLIFVLALFFAYMLSPLVNAVMRFLPKRPSSTVAALAVVYIVLIAVVASAGTVFFSRVMEEGANFARGLPTYIQTKQELFHNWPLPAWLLPVRTHVEESLREKTAELATEALPMAQELGRHAFSVLGSVGFLVLVPILSFFFLMDAAQIRENVLSSMLAESYRHFLEGLVDDLNLLLAQYIRALLLLSAATLVVYSISFGLMGVPYVALLAGICCLLEFIPVIGPLSGAVITILVALFTGHANLLLPLILFFIIYRLFQDYVLSPYLMSSGVEVHPLLVIFGALAGEQLGGVAGMFLSVPIIAALRVVMVRATRARRQRTLPLSVTVPVPVIPPPTISTTPL